MATELQVFVLVQVTVNAQLVRASFVQITRTGANTVTGTRINVNAALTRKTQVNWYQIHHRHQSCTH